MCSSSEQQRKQGLVLWEGLVLVLWGVGFFFFFSFCGYRRLMSTLLEELHLVCLFYSGYYVLSRLENVTKNW